VQQPSTKTSSNKVKLVKEATTAAKMLTASKVTTLNTSEQEVRLQGPRKQTRPN
jgi:hypothetical protein